ncbi:MAG: LysR family transcriptional regulator [Clostridia bacterium]|nr:LysR family transcriptional regulator [Clostridia bacterium]
MEFSKLEYIVKVAELGNVTRAAEELFMTQPALSHYIAKMEKEEGVKFFDRSSNPITLTYEGERYVETAKQIIELNRQLKEDMAEVTNTRKGRIRIGIPPLRAAHMLPKFIPFFTKEYPNVQIQTVEHNSRQLKDDVLKGSVDFAILPKLGDLSEFSSIPLFREELVLAAREGIIEANRYHQTADGRKIIDFGRLQDVPFILLKNGHGSRGALDTLFELHGYQPKIFMETTNNETAFGLASVGMGVAVVPFSTVLTIQHKNPVQIFHLSESGYYWEIIAIIRKNEHLNRLARECILTMKEIFADPEECQED